MRYSILEHTADLKIKVFGKDLPELFSNAALAMAEQLKPGIRPPIEGKWEKIEIKSSDLEPLLVDWLSEILYRSDVNHRVYAEIKIEEISERELKAKIRGTSIGKKDLDIKAVTYHGLEIKQIGNYWEAVIIFDV